MKVVRNRADARWLPSRHRFAIFRILSWLVYRRTGAEERPGLVLTTDRDQSALECYIVAVFVVAVGAGFVWAALPPLFWPVSAIAALFIVAVLLQVIVCLPGIGPPSIRGRNNVDLNSFITIFLLAIAAAYYAAATSWVRFVAWLFIAVMVINGLASIAIRLLRARMPDAGEVISA